MPGGERKAKTIRVPYENIEKREKLRGSEDKKNRRGGCEISDQNNVSEKNYKKTRRNPLWTGMKKSKTHCMKAWSLIVIYWSWMLKTGALQKKEPGQEKGECSRTWDIPRTPDCADGIN